MKHLVNPYNLVILSGHCPGKMGWFQAAIPAIISTVGSFLNTTVQSLASKRAQLRELQQMREQDRMYKENLVLQSSLMPQENIEPLLMGIPVIILVAYLLRDKKKDKGKK